MARMPVALIAYLDSSEMLNQTVSQKVQTNALIESPLEVGWPSIFAIVGTLSVLQIIAVGLTLR